MSGGYHLAVPSAPRNDTSEPAGQWRLQKLLARAGVASRRHAEEMIVAGRVLVNGHVADQLGTRVDPRHDVVAVDGRRVSLAESQSYLALNKPPGFVSTALDPQDRPTVMQLVPNVPGLFPVGRLDCESEGLLLFTTDGEWAQRVAHPSHGTTKEYLVEVDGRPRPAVIARLRAPMALEGGEWTSGASVRAEGVAADAALLRIVLSEGRNRQIRRMLDAVGHPVRRLVRVRVSTVHLGNLRPGEWRNLTHAEIATTAGTPVPRSELPLPRGVHRRRSA
jgi:23S rRNA pseudouridine2605 synthase